MRDCRSSALRVLVSISTGSDGALKVEAVTTVSEGEAEAESAAEYSSSLMAEVVVGRHILLLIAFRRTCLLVCNNNNDFVNNYTRYTLRSIEETS